MGNAKRNHFNIFYLAIGDYKGGIMSFRSAIGWLAFKHVGFGFGFDAFDLGVEAENSDNIGGVDFAGNIKFSYFGALGLFLGYSVSSVLWSLNQGFIDVPNGMYGWP